MKTLHSLLGNSQRLDGGAMFGNVPKALWSRWVESDEKNRILLSCRCLLVEEEKRRILFETGIGAFFSPKMKNRFGVVEEEHVLLASLAEHGLTPDHIDVVVLSHLHFDHAGGLLERYQEAQTQRILFDRATLVTSKRAYERARNPHSRDRASFIPELMELLAASQRLELTTGETSSTLGSGYKLHYSDGHTPGLLITEISMPDGPVVFASDLIPGTPWVHLPITMGYDRYPEKLIDEKQALLSELHPRKGRIFYTHDPQTAMSALERDEHGRFRAASGLPTLSALTA